MNLQALLLSFALVALAELGDKTQLAVLTLSVKYSSSKVFAGAATAYFFLTLGAVAVGAVLFNLLPDNLIRVLSSVLFLAFGIYILIKAPEQELESSKDRKGGFFTSFSLILLTELGDKTQIITITLAAKYMAPFEVFTGALLGLISVTLLSVAAGRTALHFIKNVTLLHRIAGIIFILLGLGSFFL